MGTHSHIILLTLFQYSIISPSNSKNYSKQNMLMIRFTICLQLFSIILNEAKNLLIQLGNIFFEQKLIWTVKNTEKIKI